jgi:hypothetical protein
MIVPDLPIPELLAAAERPEVLAAMDAFYAEADRRIAAQNPTCWNRGLCCRFGEYGHRLYVTALEVVYYLARTPGPATHGLANHLDLATLGDADVCPHARGGICHARDRRPLGCRIFYCDPAAQDWQGPLTEELLAGLRDLHPRLGVPYFYADWMGVLRALAAREAPLRSPSP